MGIAARWRCQYLNTQRLAVRHWRTRSSLPSACMPILCVGSTAAAASWMPNALWRSKTINRSTIIRHSGCLLELKCQGSRLAAQRWSPISCSRSDHAALHRPCRAVPTSRRGACSSRRRRPRSNYEPSPNNCSVTGRVLLPATPQPVARTEDQHLQQDTSQTQITVAYPSPDGQSHHHGRMRCCVLSGGGILSAVVTEYAPSTKAGFIPVFAGPRIYKD